MGKKLLSAKTSQDSLDCLNGLRVISMMWVVLGHGMMYQLFLPLINAEHVFLWREHLSNAFFAGMALAVDTFFTISGLLVVYLFMKSKDKGIPFSLPKFFLHRIIRLTPSLALVVLFSGTLVRYMGNGLYWPVVYQLFQKPCEEHWWSTLLYVQNYVHPQEQCVGQAWYLAVDTQMYFISPIILFPLIRWPKQTLGAMCVIILLICGYVFDVSRKNHLGATFFDQSPQQFETIYVPTHVRGNVYLIGMICGYFVYQFKCNKPLKLSKCKVLGLWAISLLVMLAIMLWNMLLVKNPDYTALEAAFFNCLTKVSWSIALSVVIVLCVNGYGGLINSFLSNKVFTILIRLNYNIYLLHVVVMAFVMGQQRNPGYFSNLNGLHKFWGDYVFTVGTSLIWTLAFESPVLALERIIFGKKVKTQKITSMNEQNTEIAIETANGKHAN